MNQPVTSQRRRYPMVLLVLVASVGTLQQVNAQLPFTHNLLSGGGRQHTPLLNDSFAADPDFQFFRRDDFREFSDARPAPTGFSASYNRLSMLVSRTNAAASSLALEDYAWGNRIDLGFMSKKHGGWQATYWNLGSPNGFFSRASTLIPLLPTVSNTSEGDDTSNTREDEFENEPVEEEQEEETLAEQAEAELEEYPGIPTLETYSDLSLNDITGSGFELNKTYRLKPLVNGLVIEPLVGLRYVDLEDRAYADAQDVDFVPGDPIEPIYLFTESVTDGEGFVDNAGGVLITSPIDGAGPIGANAIVEQEKGTFTVQNDLWQSSANNDLFGGQLGCRFHFARGRLSFDTTVKAMGFQNFISTDRMGRTTIQEVERTIVVQTTLGGTGDGTVPTSEASTFILDVPPDIEVDEASDSFTKFVLGGELRFEVGYHITDSLSLRGGFQVMNFSMGIARDRFSQDDDVTMLGATFGIAGNY